MPLAALRRSPAPARFARTAGGQALVEFAIAAPILLLLLCSVVEIGHYYYTRLSIRHVTMEAARFAATGQTLPDEDDDPMSRAASVRALIRARAEGLHLGVEDVVLDPEAGGRPGEVVRVAVRYRYDFTLPGIGRLVNGGSPLVGEVSTAMKNEPVF